MAKKSKVVPKMQIRRVMEKLIEQEIFVPAKNDWTIMNEKLPILNLFEFKFLTLQLDRFSVVNFLKKWENCPEETRQWLKREF
uniref:Uncharacterized protein n=1 Tax=Romanomermis culicivorax TaxID=13658 RepID=A0A915KZY4_ROMCU